MGIRLFGPNKLVLSVSGISPSVIRAMAEGSKVAPNTAWDGRLFQRFLNTVVVFMWSVNNIELNIVVWLINIVFG